MSNQRQRFSFVDDPTFKENKNFIQRRNNCAFVLLEIYWIEYVSSFSDNEMCEN
jgi:hypothetical protein